ncbi:MAG: 50S ribosomal protein L6 [Candidatus Woesearchaeota archaeon]
MNQTTEKLQIPEGIKVTVEGNSVKVAGKHGMVERRIEDPRITIKLEANSIVISADRTTKRERTKIGTWRAHLANMLRGAESGHTYTLKICSGHFPMNVSTTEKEFTIKNFLGEKVPRKLGLKEGAKVKIEGDLVRIESTSKELAGQTAADIEQMCKIRGRDSRIFQDGIWIIEKDGKPLK